MPQTVVLSGNPTYPPEKVCSVAVTPGHLLTEGLAGDAGKVKPHATADGGARPWFAVESLVPSMANSQVAAIDIPYAIGDAVRSVFAQPGDMLYALLATTQTIVEGDDLVSRWDWQLKKATAATAVTVGISRQIVAEGGRGYHDDWHCGPHSRPGGVTLFPAGLCQRKEPSYDSDARPAHGDGTRGSRWLTFDVPLSQVRL